MLKKKKIKFILLKFNFNMLLLGLDGQCNLWSVCLPTQGGIEGVIFCGLCFADTGFILCCLIIVFYLTV